MCIHVITSLYFNSSNIFFKKKYLKIWNKLKNTLEHCLTSLLYTGNYWESLFYNRHGGNCDTSNIRDCLYLPNGVHRDPRRSPSSFIRCYGNRLVEEGKCTIDSVWGTQTFIYNGTCTQRFAIPTSEADYGLLPSCSAKLDGNYQFRTRPCDAYYRCEGGRATAVKCPEHTLFDVTRRMCASNVACYRAWWNSF